jgi:PKD repeat protein
MKINILRSVVFTAIFSLIGYFSFAQCNAAFNDSIDSLTVYFTNQATGSYNFIGYDYGDGNFDQNIPNPTHTYAQEGIYEVCQQIFDTINFACFGSSCDTLYIGSATCAASFFPFPDGLEVEFFGQALGTSDSLVWDFGDGTSSNDTFPIHTYASAGTYTACLSLYNGGIICDSACQQFVIDTTTNSNCTADFSSTVNGLSVDFTNLSSGGYQAQYWDFGDGFGNSEDANPSYTYFVAGTYEVCLSVFDTLTGTCFDDQCYDVTVTTGGGGGGGCQAAFTYTKNELQFNGVDVSTGSILTAFWDFGDGSNPAITGDHLYDEPGVYEVCLTVANIIPFCFDETCKTVEITENTCDVDFEWSFNDQNLFAFKNLSVGNFTAVKWEFGDGNTSTFNNPNYNYNQAGTYNVCLTTFENGSTCGFGCKDVDVYPLGTEEIVASAQFMAFPNPSNGNITLSIPSVFVGSETQVSVLDLSGRLVSSANFVATGSKELMVNAASGTYFMQITSGEFSQVIPIVIK